MNLDSGFLESRRRVGDPDADRLVRALFEHLEGVGRRQPSRALLRDLIEFDALPPETFPPAMAAFLDAHDAPPILDPEAIDRGGRLFAEHGPEIMLALGCYSLPGAYAARKGAERIAP